MNKINSRIFFDESGSIPKTRMDKIFVALAQYQLIQIKKSKIVLKVERKNIAIAIT